MLYTYDMCSLSLLVILISSLHCQKHIFFPFYIRHTDYIYIYIRLLDIQCQKDVCLNDICYDMETVYKTILAEICRSFR